MLSSGRFSAILALILCFDAALARPTVRNIKSHAEFKKLLKHHAEVTGLPVVLDYYSDGCGPCRMVAPHFKQMAEQYKDKAVFAKIDINYQQQIAAEQQIRSMPTFQLYLFGKKRDQFSGADTQRLNTMTQQLVAESQQKNVEVTFESLKAFYQEHAPEKLMEMDDKKLQEILDKAGKGGGPGHFNLVKALKKKYNKAPKTQARSVSQKEGGEAPKPPSPPSSSSSSSGSKAKAEATKPNLHLASTAELESELQKRREAEEEKRAEEETDDDEESGFPIYDKNNRSEGPEQVVIVGSGPAGLSAAIYAARAGLKPVIVAPPIGGQLQGKGVGVENYPGVNETTGPALIQSMQKQAAEFGAVFEQDLVNTVDISKRPFTIKTNDTTIQSHSLILATGADSRWLNIPGEWEHRGGGVSSCATCDGFLFSNKDVVVVGGGDAAMEDALVLARTSKSVTLIHRRDTFRASKVLADRVLSNEKIKVFHFSSACPAFASNLAARLLASKSFDQNPQHLWWQTLNSLRVFQDISNPRSRKSSSPPNRKSSLFQVVWDSVVAAFEGKKVRVLPNGLTVELAEDGSVVPEDYSKMRVKEIKEKLDIAGVTYDGIKDKEGLVRLLQETMTEASASADSEDGGMVEEKSALSRVRVKNLKTDAETEIPVAAAFIAIGHDPNTKFVTQQLEMDDSGYLVTQGGSRTSIEGVFAAGDVADKVYRQAITSAGSGAMAALDAERWLSEQGHCAKAA